MLDERVVVLIFVFCFFDIGYSGAAEEDTILTPSTSPWPGGVVPYTFDRYLNQSLRQSFLEAVAHIEERSCVRFKTRTDDDDDVIVVADKGGCSSSIGRVGGEQTVSISPGCSEVGRVVHELLHVLGFNHEHSRLDRDIFVKINTENIQEGKVHDFEAFSSTEQELGVPYDYGSIMHYDLWAFSKNYRQTLTPLKNLEGVKVGQRDMLSELDVLKITTLYACQERNVCERKGMCLKGECEKVARYDYRCKCFEGYFGDRCQFAAESCDNGQHQCLSDMICTPLSYRCDGVEHCADGSDERDCERCSFEGPCSWSDADTGDVQWLPRSGPTPSRSYQTGPVFDHTLGNIRGTYRYLESSRPSDQGDRAILQSPRMYPANYTLNFWWHMFGVSIGSLKVIQDEAGTVTTLLEITGNQGDVWMESSLNVSCVGECRFQIVGVVGSGYRGDIAIDDINLSEGDSSSNPDQTFSNTCICLHGGICVGEVCQCQSGFTGHHCESEQSLCDAHLCAVGQCAIDELGAPVCIRINEKETFDGKEVVWNASHEWLRRSQQLWMDSTEYKAEGWLTSIAFSESQPNCTLELGYLLKGRDVSQMGVYVMYRGSKWSPLWMVHGPQGSKWHKAGIPIGHRYHFRVAITASYHGKDHSIAVDNINFKNCFFSAELPILSVSDKVHRVLVGSHVYLTVQVTDTMIPDLRSHLSWEHSGVPIQDRANNTYLRSNNQQLIVRSIDASRYGVYTCTMRYAGAAKTIRFVILNPQEVIPTTQPHPTQVPPLTTPARAESTHIKSLSGSNIVVSSGEDIHLKIKFSGVNPPYWHVYWSKISPNLIDLSPPPSGHYKTPDNRRSLMVFKAQSADSGIYRVEVDHNGVQDKLEIRVSVV